MRCRKNLRVLFAEYNAAAPGDKPNTALMKLKNAIVALKDPASHPSQLKANPDVAAAIASDIAMGMLAPGSALKSRYDDFVWAHHQVMMQGPNDPNGPNLAHRGPAFGPWHRQLLKLYEEELRAAAGDPDLTLPYWDWTKDQSAVDPGFPFTADFIGGDGAGNPSDKVTTGPFSQAAGSTFGVDEEGFFFLRRHFGGDGPGLPTAQSVKDALNLTTYDSSPWNRSAAGATSFRNTLEGWVGPRQIHNAVHRWVDGSMQPGTSPNDPVFFFHHCNIDRLWAVWEQKHPASAPYLPDMSTPAANGLTRLNENMATFGRTPTDRYFGVDVSPAGVVNSKAITWYDSDLPELSNETGATLAFVGVPEGLTTYKAVKFRVTGCRPVHFRITGPPSGQFGLTTMGTEFRADPDDAAPFTYGYVWVKFTAVAGPIAPSSVDIEAYIVDDEGYYAATDGGEFRLAPDFHVTLTATTVAREDNSVALVLDRSGSMADPAGGTSTKASLLKNAVGVFNSLMLPADEIALVSFDDQIATPASMQAVSAGAVPPVLATTALDPRGATCIGGGIQQGTVELASATHSNRSLLVLTDGVENVHPYVAELPAGTITARTYAIGFGLPGDISTPVLNQITSNTHGDLIVTGNITTAEQGFDLTKYFVQVLAGVTNMDVLLDPQGALFFGSRHVIPFSVTSADVYADVIVLCPVPHVLDFRLETPDGHVIDPGTGGPNVSYAVRPGVAFYRVTFPALAAAPAGSHGGTWKAILSLGDRKRVDKLLKGDEVAASFRAAAAQNGSLPYSLVAHAYSNVRFDARLSQSSLAPGATVVLEASLKAYDVAFPGDATVWAEVTAPDGGQETLAMGQTGPGRYRGHLVASQTGVYRCRERAEGYFQSSEKFTREKTLTAVTYVGDYGTTPPGGRDGCGLCELLGCLTRAAGPRSRALSKLKELGIDVDALRKCVDECCRPRPERAVSPVRKADQPRARGRRSKASAVIGDEPVAVRVEREMAAAPAATAASGQAPWPRIVHSFTPEEPDGGAAMGPDAMKAEAPVSFPRIVRMFTPPDEG